MNNDVSSVKVANCLTVCAKVLIAFVTLLVVASFHSQATAAETVMSDNFNDNYANSLLWSTTNVVGTGPSLSETNQKLEIYFPSFSNGSAFGAGYSSVCKLRGDFDVQVDYELLLWPFANGVRVGLAAANLGSPAAVERTNFSANISNDVPGWPREVYLAHFSDGVNGITESADFAGKLRLVRTGDQLTGYYFASGGWVPINTAYTSTNDTAVSLSAWSHDNIFTGQDVKLAFDNFIVNRGLAVCQGKIAVPIDIKPGSSPNSINLGSVGTVPVAILSTASFDATQVDPASVTLSGAALALKGKGTQMYSLEDVDADGRLDLVVHVTTSALQLNENDTSAILEGRLYDGTLVKGSDTVRIVP